MDAIMIAGGQGFTGRYITQRLAASGRRVISYNRDFATDEDGAHVVQGELFDVARLVRVLKEHTIEKIVHTAALSHLKLSLEFPPVELSRGRRRSGYAVEIADLLPGLFNDLGLSSLPRRLCPAITARGLSDSIVSSAENPLTAERCLIQAS